MSGKHAEPGNDRCDCERREREPVLVPGGNRLDGVVAVMVPHSRHHGCCGGREEVRTAVRGDDPEGGYRPQTE
jgi:hypothetical protein